MAEDKGVTVTVPGKMEKRITEALEFCESLRQVSFETQEHYDKGVEICKQVKQFIKILDEDRKALVQPLNEKVTNINAVFKDPLAKLKNAEQVLKEGMTDFFRREEMRKSLLEAQKQEGDDSDVLDALGLSPTAMVDLTTAKPAKKDGVSYRTTYTVEVKDRIGAVRACLENPLLHQMVSLDIPRLEKMAAAMQGNLEIAGIEIKTNKVASVRS